MTLKLPENLKKAIRIFGDQNPSYRVGNEAEGRCWEASDAFLRALQEIADMEGEVQRLCFDSCQATRCRQNQWAGHGHSHDVEYMFPFELTRLPGYSADHRYAFVTLDNGKRVNIDFTARQFNENLPYPLVWEHGSDKPLKI
jgi:hypothetical protein